MNDAWLLELQADESRPPSLRELVAAGTPPSPRAYHTATLLGDTLYVMGGVETHRSGEVQLKDLHALHLPSYRWYTPQVQHEPPAVLARHSATALDGKLWVFGGSLRAPTGTSGGRARVRFSGQLHTLSLCISPPAATEVTPRRGVAAAVQLGAPAAAATDSSPTSSSSCEETAGEVGGPMLEWKPVETSGQRPAARAEHGTAAAAGKLFVFGGQRLVSNSGNRSARKPPPARGSHDLVEIPHCVVQHPRLNDAAALIGHASRRFLAVTGTPFNNSYGAIAALIRYGLCGNQPVLSLIHI